MPRLTPHSLSATCLLACLVAVTCAHAPGALATAHPGVLGDSAGRRSWMPLKGLARRGGLASQGDVHLRPGASDAAANGSQTAPRRAGIAGFVVAKGGRLPALLLAALTDSATTLVAATDLGTIGEPDRMMRALAAVPACSELNVGVATQQILANFWMHHQGCGAARAGLLV